MRHRSAFSSAGLFKMKLSLDKHPSQFASRPRCINSIKNHPHKNFSALLQVTPSRILGNLTGGEGWALSAAEIATGRAAIHVLPCIYSDLHKNIHRGA
jgi:hypothetical protein